MESGHDKYIKAGNHTTSHEDLWILACDDMDSVRRRVAENSNCSPEILSYLSADDFADVRIAVGENPNTGPEILNRLIQDPSVDIRYSLAENHNLSLSLLQRLAEDENPYVCHRAQSTLRALKQSSLAVLNPQPDSSERIRRLQP